MASLSVMLALGLAASPPPVRTAMAPTAAARRAPARVLHPVPTSRFVGSIGTVGSVRFRLRGRRLLFGVAVLGDRTIPLQTGEVDSDGSFLLVGRLEGDYVRLRGTVRGGGAWVLGRYQGVLHRKRIEGIFSAVRR